MEQAGQSVRMTVFSWADDGAYSEGSCQRSCMFFTSRSISAIMTELIDDSNTTGEAVTLFVAFFAE